MTNLPAAPAQPGAAAGNGDSTAEKVTVTGGAVATPAASLTGSSVRSTIAVYRALQAAAEEVAAAVEGQPSPSRAVFITTSDQDLNALVESSLFHRQLASVTQSIAGIRSSLESDRSPEAVKLMSATGAVSKIISDIIVPLAPKFSFSDAQVTVESSAFLMLVAGAISENIEVYTPFSISLRQSDPGLQSSPLDALISVSADARALAMEVSSLPDATRASKADQVEANEALLVLLRRRVEDNPEFAHRLVRGAALASLLADAAILHVSVFAAGTELHERGFLLWANRKHAGGMAASYSLYARNGKLLKGGLVQHVTEYP